jgi:nucleotide-binding universal stress UspA family protein
MFERMLLAIDGSGSSDEAVETAVEAARAFGSKVVVVHVQGHRLTWDADLDVETTHEARAIVDAALETLRNAGISAVGDVVHTATGDTAKEILRMAGSTGATLIVMGTRGLTGSKAAVLGSVANSVVHLAPCPVLLTPRGMHDRASKASTSTGTRSAGGPLG